MEIETISRKISGSNFDNLSATASIEEGEDPVNAMLKLDAQLQGMLEKIKEQEMAKFAAEQIEYNKQFGEDDTPLPF